MKDRTRPFVPNPALGSLLGLGMLAAAARDLPSGLLLGLGAALSATTLGTILPAIRPLVPDSYRSPLSLALSALLALAYSLAIEAYLPLFSTALWIYLPLLAVNHLGLHAMSLGDCPTGGAGDTRARIGAIAKAAGAYFLLSSLLGAFREIAGAGTLTVPTLDVGGFQLVLAEKTPLPLLTDPAGGFILLGLLTALYRGSLRARGRRIP